MKKVNPFRNVIWIKMYKSISIVRTVTISTFVQHIPRTTYFFSVSSFRFITNKKEINKVRLVMPIKLRQEKTNIFDIKYQNKL